MSRESAPRDESLFLSRLRVALSKRSKSISRRRARLVIEAVTEIFDNDSPARDRLDVLLRTRVKGVTVTFRLFAWSDRWVTFGAHGEVKAGWVWRFETEGRCFGENCERELVARLEECLDVVGEEGDSLIEGLESVWGPFLARSPRRAF